MTAAQKLTDVITQIIEFAKMLPGFLKFPQEDQIVLLKAGTQIDRQTDRQKDRQTDRQIDRQIDRQTDIQTYRQTDRLIDNRSIKKNYR